MEQETKALGLFDSFELPNGRKVRFKKPSVGDVEKVNVLTSEYAGRLLREGKLMTKQEIQALLEARGDAAAIMNEKINASFEKLKSLELKYDKVEDPHQKETIASQIQKMQLGIIEGLQSSTEIYNVSVESQIERYRRYALMQLVTLNEDGTLYWPTMQALENEEDLSVYNNVALRFSELQGTIALTDEQRYAMQELLKAEAEGMNLEAVFGERSS